jgi:membrane-associated protease RseP (regulator of RpoE activity)
VAVSTIDGLLVESASRVRPRYWLHLLLFLLTFITTAVVGAGLSHSFAQGRPFNFDIDFGGYRAFWHQPRYLIDGLPFSLTLLTILLAHELGHYVAARYYRVDVTLPYFLPAPTLIGTLGAFIRIKSPIYSKRTLFDIGIAGPIAGFVVLIPPLVVGVSLSKVIPGIAEQGELVFGTPLVLRLCEWLMFPGVPTSDIYLHPVARAAWVGTLATALNLLPIGQLDGGHILYSFVGERSKLLSRIFAAALIPLGVFFYWGWIFWAVILFLIGMRHPSIYDDGRLGLGRARLGVAALAIFLLSFTLAPIRTAGL